MFILSCYFFFFFQAEDGIRDLIVTGVQTCALPICCRSWWPASGERHRTRRLGIVSSSITEGTRRELREACLEESAPIPPQARPRRFLNGSSRPPALCEGQWNESYGAQWRPTPIGADVPECHVLSERSAPRWPHQPRSAPVRSSDQSVPDRAESPRPPRVRDLERLWPPQQSGRQKAMSASHDCKGTVLTNSALVPSHREPVAYQLR